MTAKDGGSSAATAAGEPDVTMLYVLHDAFRRDLRRFVETLEATANGDKARATVLLDHWQFFTRQMHHHHSAEDDALWPILQERVPDVGRMLDQMVVQHAGLDVAIARVTEFFESFTAGKGPLAREWLIDALYRAADLVNEHFTAEEERAIPLVRGHLSAADWDSYWTYQMRTLSTQELAESIPWLLEGQSAERVAFVLGELTPQARQSYEQMWLPAYEQRAAKVWGASVH